jgi:hypothetical protein
VQNEYIVFDQSKLRENGLESLLNPCPKIDEALEKEN